MSPRNPSESAASDTQRTELLLFRAYLIAEQVWRALPKRRSWIPTTLQPIVAVAMFTLFALAFCTTPPR